MSLEHLLIPYIDYLTFGIHIAVGIVIGISVIIALVGIFRILLLNYRNEKNEILVVVLTEIGDNIAYTHR